MKLDALVAKVPYVWHATFEGGWEQIRRTGLWSAVDLLDSVERGKEAERVRTEVVALSTPEGDAVLRNQIPNRKDPAPYLDGVTVEEWWTLVNSRSYFFASERDLDRLIGSYEGQGTIQEVIKCFTGPLLSPVADHVELTTVNAGVFPRESGPSRGRATFQPLAEFVGDLKKIKEITVTCRLPIAESAVVKVMRVEPGVAPVRIWPAVTPRQPG